MNVYVDSGDCELTTLSSESILVMGEVSKQLLRHSMLRERMDTRKSKLALTTNVS